LLTARYFNGPSPAQWDERSWARATGAALAERIGPAVGEAAATLGVELPKNCWAALTAARLDNQRRAGAHLQALDELAPLIDRRGVTAAVFKGLASARHYPDPTVREAADVDLLVPADQLSELEGAFQEAGFRHSAGGGRLASRYALTYTRAIDGEDEIAFDLHPQWHDVTLEEGGRVARVAAWREDVGSVRLGSRDWRVLPLSVELYLTAAHAVLSNLRTLSVYLDLAVLLGGANQAVVDRAAEMARATGRERHLRHAMTTARDLFAADVVSDFVSLPARLRTPLALRLGYLGSGIRFLPSSLAMELLLVRGLRRKLGFARWVLGHGEREGAAAKPAGGKRWLKAFWGLRWFRGTLLRYRVPGGVTLR
jgi:hypothetical protein